jgi:hypothetical protein
MNFPNDIAAENEEREARLIFIITQPPSEMELEMEDYLRENRRDQAMGREIEK